MLRVWLVLDAVLQDKLVEHQRRHGRHCGDAERQSWVLTPAESTRAVSGRANGQAAVTRACTWPRSRSSRRVRPSLC